MLNSSTESNRRNETYKSYNNKEFSTWHYIKLKIIESRPKFVFHFPYQCTDPETCKSTSETYRTVQGTNRTVQEAYRSARSVLYRAECVPYRARTVPCRKRTVPFNTCKVIYKQTPPPKSVPYRADYHVNFIFQPGHNFILIMNDVTRYRRRT
jgi:hypothetical protein